MTATDFPRTLWIGLPAYNEESSIPSLFSRFREALKEQPMHYRVVLYNDGCTDGTVAEARKWEGILSVEIIGRPENRGLGEGVRRLVEHAVAHGGPDDALILMDCDDTHHPRQFAALIQALRDGADVAIASRYRRGSQIAGVSLFRQTLSLGATVLFKLLHPLRGVLDYTCGFRAYRLSLLRRAAERYGDGLVKERGFSCMVELLLKLGRVQARFAEIPIDLRYDLKQGPSKMDVGGNTLRLLRKMWGWRLRGMA